MEIERPRELDRAQARRRPLAASETQSPGIEREFIAPARMQIYLLLTYIGWPMKPQSALPLVEIPAGPPSNATLPTRCGLEGARGSV